MKQVRVVVSAMLLLLCSLVSHAQQTISTNTNAVVPPLVNFSGVLTDVNGKPITTTGVVGVSFLFYSEQEGGAPLWMETQNVQPDKNGYYTVMLDRPAAPDCRRTFLLPAKHTGWPCRWWGKPSSRACCW